MDNKLVRDNITDIIEKDGEIPVIRTLSENEYKKELYKKLLEECNATTSEHIIEEASDVFEVLCAISELEGGNIDKVIRTSNEKKEKKRWIY